MVNLAQSSCKYRTIPHVEDKQTIVINWEKESLGPVSLLPQGMGVGRAGAGGMNLLSTLSPQLPFWHCSAPLDTSPGLRQSEPHPPPGTPTTVPGHPGGS